ncbi:hypothetical protein M8J77_021012 [Diaphorina citri]|nr:hypothetical protein M8J77_021012 [Diaphorina citri]
MSCTFSIKVINSENEKLVELTLKNELKSPKVERDEEGLKVCININTTLKIKKQQQLPMPLKKTTPLNLIMLKLLQRKTIGRKEKP